MQGERFSEDLRQLAVEAWEVAGRLCGSCRNLHVLWPFQRLAGSPGQDVAIIHPVLNRLLSAAGRRVLIAGCADTGLLALVVRAANPGTAITVVDQCETPLELCQRFAKRWAIAVDTNHLDLTELTATSTFDVVFAHELLQHIPADRRVDTLLRMRHSMRADGRLVLVFHTSNRVDGNLIAAYRQHFPQHLIERLEVNGIELPEAREAFRRRAEAYSDEWRKREGALGSRADVEGLLGAAGFDIEELTPIQVDRPEQFRELAAKVDKQRFLAIARSSF
jgi:SAM-dependent methyltransferase